MEPTLDILPGEGEIQVIEKKQIRIICDNCGENAHYHHTYLLPNARNNCASKAYRKDDCSWCSDAEAFTCRECKEIDVRPKGYEWCSTFPATKAFAHMFLKWKEKKLV